jgi:CarboxypepD_reg-like domain
MKKHFITFLFIIGIYPTYCQVIDLSHDTDAITLKPMQIFINDISKLNSDSLFTCLGAVRDSSSLDTLIGVDIIIVGTKEGIASDLKGKFKVSKLQKGDVLSFSSLGYITKKIPVIDIIEKRKVVW